MAKPIIVALVGRNWRWKDENFFVFSERAERGNCFDGLNAGLSKYEHRYCQIDF